jgi:hypothetical protein
MFDICFPILMIFEKPFLGRMLMGDRSAPDPGRDEDPARGQGPAPSPQSGDSAEDPGSQASAVTPDWMDDAEWERFCATRAARDDEEPPEEDEEFCPGPDHEPQADISADEMTAQALADGQEHAAMMARLRAAGLDGYAHHRGDPPVPGVFTGLASGFGQGCALDEATPCTDLSGLADEASGQDRAFTAVTDDQLMGLMGTRQRLECRQAWELLVTVAEFIRRRPKPGCGLDLAGRMPQVWDEHAASELAIQLHLTAGAADELLDLAHDLTVKLPATLAALRDGIIGLDKVHIIALRCSPLNTAEARAAEAILFGQAGVEEMTWGMIRDRIARAVIEVNPEAAIRRREDAAKTRRVEIVPEDSGNTMIAGRELPPAAALAASQMLTARARELRKAGIEGGMDELRVLAYLEKLGVLNPLAGSQHNSPHGGTDGGPDRGPAGNGDRDGGNSSRDDGNSGDDDRDDDRDGNGDREDGHGGDGDGGNGGPGPGGPQPGGTTGPGGADAVPGDVPAGFAARVNLTIPLATLQRLAERPGVMSRTGPIDPALARDLAAAAARNPRSTWCVTVTGPDGRPVAHGCGRPPPRAGPGHRDRRRQDRRDQGKQGQADAAARDGPVYIPGGEPGLAGSGTLRLNLGTRDLVFAMESLAGPCDHGHQAAGHDPGLTLKHLTGILNACCTFPPCRRPEAQCDYEHSTPYDKGGMTCLCEGGPVCRHNHRDKQAPGWRLEQAGSRGWFRWTTPSGRRYLSGPTQYPD